MRRFLAALAVLSSVGAAGPAQALSFNLIDLNNTVKGTAAEAGFRIAADYWSSVLTNDVTLDVVVNYQGLGPRVLGATASNVVVFSTASYYQALAASSTSALDTIAVSHLSPLSDKGGVSMITPGYRNDVLQTGVDWSKKVYDTDNTTNNTKLLMNTAVAKAVGYDFDNNGVDAGITFSSNFSFDFDPSNGVDSKAIDFIGVAVHEMGHMLGFSSGVDDYDQSSNRQLFAQRTPIMKPLDLFRYSNDPNNLAPGDHPVLDMTPGTASFFSIDGSGAFSGDAYFSTGNDHGDGEQASHWKDAKGCGEQIGVMDPTFCFGQMGVVTRDDLAALDAIGWNLSMDVLKSPYSMSTADIYRRFSAAVPEPATWSMLILGFLMIGMALRRQDAPALA